MTLKKQNKKNFKCSIKMGSPIWCNTPPHSGLELGAQYNEDEGCEEWRESSFSVRLNSHHLSSAACPLSSEQIP